MALSSRLMQKDYDDAEKLLQGALLLILTATVTTIYQRQKSFPAANAV